MTRIQKLADGLLGLFTTRVTASADPSYYVYHCQSFSCPEGGGFNHRRKRCNDGYNWCSGWENVGCCTVPN
jgi:hypothetical protein